jgi:hypothetical protein
MISRHCKNIYYIDERKTYGDIGEDCPHRPEEETGIRVDDVSWRMDSPVDSDCEEGNCGIHGETSFIDVRLEEKRYRDNG